MLWKENGEISVLVAEEPFNQGFFRKTFRAVKYTSHKVWVLKRCKKVALKNLYLGHEEHARKEVQMHTVAQRLEGNAPKEFGETFVYGKVYFSIFEGEPVTVEEYADGDFVKYVNNDGNCGAPVPDDRANLQIFYDKFETLVHFTNSVTEEKMMLLDIQGSGFQLYDPEFETKELLDNLVISTFVWVI